MRVNVYAEELTTDVKEVHTHVHETDTDKTYTGLRFFLLSASDLHNTSDDDDRSAVTFWGSPKRLHELFTKALRELEAG